MRVALDGGWHLNSHSPLQDYLIPTRLRLKDSKAAELLRVHYPDGSKVALGFSADPLSVYAGKVWITGKLKIADDARPGELPLVFLFNGQACNDDSCLAPEMDELAASVEVDSGTGEASGTMRHEAVFRQHHQE